MLSSAVVVVVIVASAFIFISFSFLAMCILDVSIVLDIELLPRTKLEGASWGHDPSHARFFS